MSKNILINKVIAYRQSLMNVIGKIAPPSEVEDIVQDAYVKMFQIQNNKPIEYPKAFLYKIAVNLAKDFNKKSEVRLTSSTEDESDFSIDLIDSTYHKVNVDEEFSNACEAVKSLPVHCRRVFVLRKIYGFSHKEIVDELKLSPHTVESHIANAMKRIEQYNDSISKEKSKKVKLNLTLGNK